LSDASAILFDFIEKGKYKYEQEAQIILENPATYIRIENLRIGLALIPYIATGDKSFLVQVNAQNIPSLLEQMVHGANCSYDFDGVQAIHSDQYFAIYQLAKNAKRNLYGLKVSNIPVNEVVEIKIQEDSAYVSVAVRDEGTGIPEDVLPKIFGTYTTGGTGIGLQVVKRILDLRGGYAEVISTQSGKPTFKYDTRINAVCITEPKPQGSTFTLYFPKP